MSVVVVKEERAKLEIQMKAKRVAYITYSNSLSIDILSQIRSDDIRREITFYQYLKTNVTIEELTLSSSYYLEYSMLHLIHFLRKAGYKTVTIFVFNQDRVRYESLGFRQVEYIEDLNMVFMIKPISD